MCQLKGTWGYDSWTTFRKADKKLDRRKNYSSSDRSYQLYSIHHIIKCFQGVIINLLF